ncbi:NAD-dependent epimerase/dehydratase family protein [Litoreibacter janthinus]|uniref:dTDP-glucose 4,6-dehydratase n=1 Tax=Litoreibacter janthinus TaxID=670154 RepID=A0A1I6FUZ0_9RHOB|nr:NAD(P)-dependent oxidoreductase [Litoreibacter janthinus]SFR33706.1 dTDP-glucose 4,6-dehydratase [Litoreibacter janthinus]
MKVIVAGVNGFIGRAMARYLQEVENAEVLGLVRDLNEAPATDGIRLVSKLEAADCMINLAGSGGIPESFTDPVAAFQSTCTLTAALLGQAIDLNIPKFVLASTCAVYPTGPNPSSEDGPFDLNSPYAQAKFAAETYLRSAFEITGIDAKSVRLANVYGPFQTRQMIQELAERAQSGDGPVSIRSSGAERRDFLHVDDCAAGLWTLCQNGDAGGIYNLGSGEPRRIYDVAQQICSHFGKSLEAKEPDVQYEGQHDAFPDVTKARHLGVYPRVSFDAGLKATLERLVK